MIKLASLYIIEVCTQFKEKSLSELRRIRNHTYSFNEKYRITTITEINCPQISMVPMCVF